MSTDKIKMFEYFFLMWRMDCFYLTKTSPRTTGTFLSQSLPTCLRNGPTQAHRRTGTCLTPICWLDQTCESLTWLQSRSSTIHCYSGNKEIFFWRSFVGVAITSIWHYNENQKGVKGWKPPPLAPISPFSTKMRKHIFIWKHPLIS